jgi:hypothetical protein
LVLPSSRKSKMSLIATKLSSQKWFSGAAKLTAPGKF